MKYLCMSILTYEINTENCSGYVIDWSLAYSCKLLVKGKKGQFNLSGFKNRVWVCLNDFSMVTMLILGIFKSWNSKFVWLPENKMFTWWKKGENVYGTNTFLPTKMACIVNYHFLQWDKLQLFMATCYKTKHKVFWFAYLTVGWWGVFWEYSPKLCHVLVALG